MFTYLDKQMSTPLPVSYDQRPKMEAKGFDLLPMLSAIIKSLPESIRRNLLLKVRLKEKRFYKRETIEILQMYFVPKIFELKKI